MIFADAHQTLTSLHSQGILKKPAAILFNGDWRIYSHTSTGWDIGNPFEPDLSELSSKLVAAYQQKVPILIDLYELS